ncbi:uncharacterized protein ARMOST_19464 [Armillaria ostoyae]|uniref:Uncharacterized protein n=1 Tax=Armillaria ostoyae TaxID=47428 RepID=A0A284S4L2_ARMOS|nr:uncharacterized protein ARMOST_19464 [Armillaria ostoyae]
MYRSFLASAPPASHRAVSPPQTAACNLRDALPGVSRPPTILPAGIKPVFTSMVAKRD